MVVDFSKINFNERPVLILKNAGGTPLGVLGGAYNISPDLKYNELSSISFSISSWRDGHEEKLYDDVIGMRVVELHGIGQFILTRPKETNDGVCRIKECTAYSLEYGLNRKQITIGEGVYRFFSDVSTDETLLGMIMEYAPGWKIGYVSQSLKGRYRTFDAQTDNLYNFIKNSVQKSLRCVFEFDTLNMLINVRDADEDIPAVPAFFSTQNLLASIDIEENVEDIATCVDINGSDGVDIRDVNPCGTNQIINLDYYMNEKNFPADLIQKYYSWKDIVSQNRRPYYQSNIQYSLKVMQLATETAALKDLENSYTALENSQAVVIQAIAQGMSTQKDLDDANAKLAEKRAEIDAKNNELISIQSDIDAAYDELVAIRDACNFNMYFTAEEIAMMNPYLIDDAIEETSFVASETEAYTDDGGTLSIANGQIDISGETVEKSESAYGSQMFDVRGGSLECGDTFSGNIISLVAEKKTDNTFVLTAYLSSVQIRGESFPTGCLTMTGDGCSISESSSIRFSFDRASIYFTLNASEFEKRSVAWDLYEYGESVVAKVSRPSYSFSVESANFLSIKEFVSFRDAIQLGRKVIIDIGTSTNVTTSVSNVEDIDPNLVEIIDPDEFESLDLAVHTSTVLCPILIGVSFNYDKPEELALEFSSSFVAGNPEFRMVDILEKSISMGRKLDVSKYIYSAFSDSGASTGIKQFMTSALDVAKNAIMSSTDQAVSWDGAGLRLRKWSNAEKTAYDDEQIWMNNNSIVMTQDGWATAQMAIGKFHDANLGDCWGIVAPRIVGTLLAGGELIIESAKKDGGTAVFRVDADGARLYNSEFSVRSGTAHITLNPDVGIVTGVYPVYTEDAATGKKTLNEDNARFWADTSGNVHFKGTLHGANGEFTGYIKATHNDGSYFVVNGASMGFYNAESSPMLSYANGIMTLYGAIRAESKDGAYFRVDGEKMGFFSADGTAFMQYANGGLTLTGAINATSLSIITNGSSSTIEDYVNNKIGAASLEVTDDYIIATVRNSEGYKSDLAALQITSDNIVLTVRQSNGYKNDLAAKADSSALTDVQDTLQTQITANANGLTSKVSSGEVSSMIEQSLKDISLTAENINLIGYTTINGYFQIDAFGKLIAKDGTFNGVLTAGKWTFDSSGAKYTVNSACGRIYSNGSTMYYDTYGMNAQYGADTSHNTTIYGNYLKLVPATASCGILVCNSATANLGTIDYEDPTLICDGATNDGSWTGSCGNLGTRYYRWDIGWCKTMRTSANYNDSSRLVKHNIKPLPDMGEIIDALSPVSFVYNWDTDDKVSYGLIVEDTVDILPNICLYDVENPEDRAIDYAKLVPVLLREIQSLRARVASIENI